MKLHQVNAVYSQGLQTFIYHLFNVSIRKHFADRYPYPGRPLAIFAGNFSGNNHFIPYTGFFDKLTD